MCRPLIDSGYDEDTRWEYRDEFNRRHQESVKKEVRGVMKVVDFVVTTLLITGIGTTLAIWVAANIPLKSLPLTCTVLGAVSWTLGGITLAIMGGIYRSIDPVHEARKRQELNETMNLEYRVAQEKIKNKD